MASFLCDVVKKYAEKLIDGAIAEARHAICFTCIVKEFEEERAKLEPERETIKQHVKVAKERDKDIPANVGSWQKDIDELNQVDTKSKQTCFFGFCPDCIWRYKKGKELTNKVKWINELKAKVETLEIKNIELSRCLPGVERYSSQDYIPFESREAKYKHLLDALKDDNNYITGLQGMGGTGKTTLAKKVGEELKQSKQFDYVVNTTVSFTPDVKKIQDEIAGSVGLKWEDCNEVDRPKKLWSRLTNGDKILVILDDVWDQVPPLDFDAIGIPKQDTCKGCKVLVTSRNNETFNKMDCDRIIELGLLSEEEAWTMFKRYAKISNSSSKKWIDKGREIAKECKQLPVAISVIASSLKGHQHQEHKWDVTLKSLKKPGFMRGVDNNKVGIYNCLKISYDNLMDDKVKRLFLLCSVFREDEEYSEVLTRLCIGVSLFGEDCDSYDDGRNEVVKAKEKLVDSCLLLEVGEKCLRMHDLVREAAQWIAKEEIQCVNLFDKKQKSSVEKMTNIKYLLCEGKCMDLFSFHFDGSKLETFIVKVDKDDDQESIEVPNSFFKNVIKLRVLYFSGKDHRPLSLPSSIGLLTNIRSMSFDNVDLGDITILGKLQTLETLELVRCKIEELPDQITELGKFKLLKLDHCEIRMKNPFEVIKRCSSLEELYFKESLNDFCQEITLPELQRYHFQKGYEFQFSRFPKYVLFYCDEDETCQFSEETLKYCMQTAEAIFLRGIKGEWRNLMPKIVSVEQGMNDVVELYLVLISQLQCLIDTTGSRVPNVFSKLVVLELYEVENLEELFKGSLSFESLNNLENLSITNCKHLQSLFKCKVNLCNLKTFKIWNCPMLVSILPFLSAQDLPALEAMRIGRSDGLKYVFGQSQQHVELVSLTELEMCALPNFIGIFEECCLDIWERAQCLPIQSKILYNIKKIELSEFPKMKSVLILSSIAPIMQLETLIIGYCDELKHIIIIDTGDHNTGGNSWVNVFPKLKYIHVLNCLQLEYIFGYDINDRQNRMEIQLHFPELRHLNLSNLPSLVAMCPKQYQTTFPSLERLDLVGCSQFDIKSIFHPVSESMDHTIIKELMSGNVDHFLTLEMLELNNNSKVENIFSLNEIDGRQQLDLGLKKIELCDLPMMTRLFVGHNNSFALINLTFIEMVRCDKLKIAFSTSILRFLPQLRSLRIEECKELEHIIEDDDLENTKFSTTCFPNLETLAVIKCNKLKSVLPFSVCKELPKLRVILITEANEVEEIFKSEDDDQKVDIPNLNFVAFDMLPILCGAQGNQFQAVKHRFVRNCQKLTLTSASATSEEIFELYNTSIDLKVYCNLRDLFEQLPSEETTEDFEKPSVENVQDLTISPTNSKELLNEQSLGETDTIVKPSQLEGSTSEKTAVATVSTISGTKNEPPIQGIEIEGVSKTNNDQVSLNEEASMKVNLNVEVQFSKRDEIIVSKSEPSPSITSAIEPQFPSMLSKGDPSQKVEDLISSLPVKRELEELISKNHVHFENLSLLTDFLVKNPSVRLKDSSLGNIYKGCAYNSLAELLKFLKTHSLLEVSGPCHSKFLELLQGARNFSFDKDWLDGVERRTLFPEIQVSQDAVEKLLASKERVTKDVEDLKHQLTSSETVLESIIQQEAVLRAPIGY